MYTLYNKQRDKKLTHPKIGLWYTPDLPEAQEMFTACLEHLDAVGLSEVKKHIVIIEAETGEELAV